MGIAYVTLGRLLLVDIQDSLPWNNRDMGSPKTVTATGEYTWQISIKLEVKLEVASITPILEPLMMRMVPLIEHGLVNNHAQRTWL